MCIIPIDTVEGKLHVPFESVVHVECIPLSFTLLLKHDLQLCIFFSLYILYIFIYIQMLPIVAFSETSIGFSFKDTVFERINWCNLKK